MSMEDFDRVVIARRSIAQCNKILRNHNLSDNQYRRVVGIRADAQDVLNRIGLELEIQDLEMSVQVINAW